MRMYKNYTPHAIVFNDGRIFEPSGSVARVSASYSTIVDDVCQQVFGEVEGLPDAVEGTTLIVSAMILGASDRLDLVAPATGHSLCIRNEKGHIVSVPCFVRR